MVEVHHMAKKKKKPNQRMQEWIDARKHVEPTFLERAKRRWPREGK